MELSPERRFRPDHEEAPADPMGTSTTRSEKRSSCGTEEAVRIDQGKVVVPSRETFAEYLPKWLERRSRLRMYNRAPLSPNTVETYRRYIVNDILPSRLGAMRLRDIRRAAVQAFLDDLVRSGRGAVTVHRIAAVIQSALSTAAKSDLIRENPARDLELPEHTTKEVRAWEPDEVGRFLDHAATHRLGPFFELAVWTGLRRAELVQLEWSDVDLARRHISVRRSTTKTDAGRRRVPLNDAATRALVVWRVAQAAEREAWGAAYTSSDRVFTQADGRALQLQYPTRLFDRLRQETGLPPLTLHGLRHQCASLLIASGADLEFVREILGHTDVRVTSGIYSHMLQSTGRDRVDAAAALVPRTSTAHTECTHEGGETTEAVPAESGNGP
jgi:integrase